MNLVEQFFLTSLAVVFYTYIGFPLLLFILATLKKMSKVNMPVPDALYEPTVALIVPCYNEGYILEQKVQNCLLLNYPKNKLEVIFIIDGSTDSSQQILAKHSQIKVLFEPERKGKAAAENRAIKHTQAEVVIFCDANTSLNNTAIKSMVAHFADVRVGAVSGEKRIEQPQANSTNASGEGLYWKYESFLKKLESQLHTLVGAAGELIAFRRTCFEMLEHDVILDDFVATMRIAISGKKVVYEPMAYAIEGASLNTAEEIKRKVRIAAGAWQAMFRLPKALNPFNDALLSYLYFSHKIFRWVLAPFALLVLIPSGYLLHLKIGGVFTLFWIGQQLFYLLAILGRVFDEKKIYFKAFAVPYYFVVANYCQIAGLIRFLKRRQSVNWEKVKRL